MVDKQPWAGAKKQHSAGQSLTCKRPKCFHCYINISLMNCFRQQKCAKDIGRNIQQLYSVHISDNMKDKDKYGNDQYILWTGIIRSFHSVLLGIRWTPSSRTSGSSPYRENECVFEGGLPAPTWGGRQRRPSGWRRANVPHFPSCVIYLCAMFPIFVHCFALAHWCHCGHRWMRMSLLPSDPANLMALLPSSSANWYNTPKPLYIYIYICIMFFRWWSRL